MFGNVEEKIGQLESGKGVLPDIMDLQAEKAAAECIEVLEATDGNLEKRSGFTFSLHWPLSPMSRQDSQVQLDKPPESACKHAETMLDACSGITQFCIDCSGDAGAI